jgi:type I restriction enzyme, S subunit
MSLPKYSGYKDSGVEWLGEVPEAWQVKRIKYVIRKLGQGWSPQCENLPAADGEWAVLKVGCVNGGIFNPDENKALPVDLPAIPELSIRAGDVLISRANTRELVGSAAVARSNFPRHLLCDKLYRLETNSRLCLPEYLASYLCTPHSRAQIELDATGASSSMVNIGQATVTGMLMPIPDPHEQSLIMTFLSRETAKIDSLVGEQQRLIELLKEKRQAVISHAVIKGLNPDALMKDSGIEWLCQVPAHWMVASVRRVIERIEQGWSPECIARPAELDEWGVVKSGCVNRGVFVEKENKALPEMLDPIPAYEIQAGDVLMSRASGSPELVGSTAYIMATRPKLMLSDKIFRIHPKPNCDPEFFVALLNSHPMRSQIERAISGAEGLANNLPQSALKGLFCVVPPMDEQLEIVRYINSQCAELKVLTTEAERAMDLLKERRTALISAAVTGKIDVRGLVEVSVV